jgi:uncharacterized YccA/Bax inhibitor family protein
MRTESSNPALARSPFAAAARPVGFDRPQRPGSPDAQVPAWQSQGDPVEQAYYGPTATSADTGRMTVEDVIVRTGVLLVTAMVTGALTWTLGLYALALPAAIVGLVLGLVIAFKQVTNPAVIVSYAAIQGVFLGGISYLFTGFGVNAEIVLQAIIGTAAVAAAMLFAYKSGRIRVTPQFTKMVIIGTMGFLALIVVNLVASFFIPGGLGLRDGGPLAIGISLLAIGLASLNLVLDFDLIEKGAQQGVPQRYGWFAAFGLMVTLVWLYIEILRLLSYFTNRD